MIVHPNFVFFHLQKAGGATVRKFLIKQVPGCVFVKNSFMQERQPENKDKDGVNVRTDTAHTPAYLWGTSRNVFKFGTIRNPWSYYVSWWYSNHISENSHSWDSVHVKKDFKTFMMSCLESKDLVHDIDFEMSNNLDIGSYTYRYLKSFYSFPMILYEGNINLIHKDIRRWMILDSVIIVENLTDGLEHVFKKYLTPLNEKQIEFLKNMEREHKTEHRPYQDYYDNELIDIVGHKDRIIVDNYGYKYDHNG